MPRARDRLGLGPCRGRRIRLRANRGVGAVDVDLTADRQTVSSPGGRVQLDLQPVDVGKPDHGVILRANHLRDLLEELHHGGWKRAAHHAVFDALHGAVALQHGYREILADRGDVGTRDRKVGRGLGQLVDVRMPLHLQAFEGGQLLLAPQPERLGGFERAGLAHPGLRDGEGGLEHASVEAGQYLAGIHPGAFGHLDRGDAPDLGKGQLGLPVGRSEAFEGRGRRGGHRGREADADPQAAF